MAEPRQSEIEKAYQAIYGDIYKDVLKSKAEDFPTVEISDAILEVHGAEAYNKWKADPTQWKEYEEDVFLLRRSKKDAELRAFLKATGRTEPRTTVGVFGPRKALRMDPAPTEKELKVLEEIGAVNPSLPTELEMTKARNQLLKREEKHAKMLEKQAARRAYKEVMKEKVQTEREKIFFEEWEKKKKSGWFRGSQFVGSLVEEAAKEVEAKLPIQAELKEELFPKGPAGLLQQFMADPKKLNKADLNKLSDAMHTAYLSGDINKDEWEKIDIRIGNMLDPSKRIDHAVFMQRQRALEKKEQGKGLNEARERLRDVLYLNEYRAAVKRLGDEPLTRLKEAQLQSGARDRATRKVNALKFSTTMEYRDPPKVGLSNIRNAELGYVFDKATNSYRQASLGELFRNIFKRQRISAPDETQIQRAIEFAYREIPKLKAGVFKETAAEEMARNLERAKMVEYIQSGILMMEGKHGKDWKDIDPEMWEKKLEIDKKFRSATLKPMTRGRFETITGALGSLLQKEEEEGGVYETPLTAGLRIGFGLPGAVLSALATEGPLRKAGFIREYEGYRRHKVIGKDETGLPIPVEGPQNVARQAMLNYATFQGLPEGIPTIEPIQYALGDTGAFALGLGMMLFEPVTGFSWPLRIARVGLKGTGTMVKGFGGLAQSRQMMRLGQIIKNAGHPIQSLKSNRIVELVDDMVKGERPAKEIQKELYGTWTPGEQWDFFKKEASHNRLSRKISDDIGVRLAVVSMVKAFGESGGVDIVTKLPSTPAARRLIVKARQGVQSAQKEVDAIRSVGEPRLKINEEKILLQIANEEMEMFKKAAKENPLLNRAYNKAQDAMSIIGKRDKIAKAIKDEQFTTKITALNQELFEEIVKVRFAKFVEKGLLSQEEFLRIAQDFAKLPREMRTERELQKILKPLNLKFSEGLTNLEDMIVASSKTFSNNIERGLLDFFPTDRILMGTDTLVPLEALETKILGIRDPDKSRGVKGFQKAWEKLLGKDLVKQRLDLAYPTAVLSKGQKDLFFSLVKKDEIMKIIVDEVSPYKVRESPFYQDLLKSIDADHISMPEFRRIKELLTDKLAREHLGGVRMTEAGEQFKRARVPPEVRESFLAVPTKAPWEKKRPKAVGYAPSGMIQEMKDIYRVFSKYLRAKDKQWMRQYKPASVANPVAVAKTLENIQNAVPKIEKNFFKEIAEARKTGANPLDATNKVFDDTWTMERRSFDEGLDDFVNRHFNGSYKDYLYTVMKAEDAAERTTYVHQIEIIIRSRVPKGEVVPDSLYRELVLDFESYVVKLDVWDGILRNAYGNSSEISRAVEKENAVTGFIKKNFRRGETPPAQELRDYRPQSSNTLNPNLSNLEVVMSRIESVDPQLTGKRLRKPKSISDPIISKRGEDFQDAAAASLLPWAMKSRLARVADKELRTLIDQNPEYAMAMVSDPLAPAMALDMAPVYHRYKDVGFDLLKELDDFRPVLERRVIVGSKDSMKGADIDLDDQVWEFLTEMSDALTKQHIRSLNRISPKDKMELLGWMTAVMIRKGTTRPDMNTIHRKTLKISDAAIKPLETIFNEYVDKAIKLVGVEKPGKEQTKVIQGLWEKVRDEFLGIGKKDKAYLGSMNNSAYGAAVDQFRQFWQSAGATLGDKIFETLVVNRPFFGQLRNSNYAMMFGKDFAETVEQMHDMMIGKGLKSFIDGLQAHGEGRVVAQYMSDVVDAGRRMTSNGLLGGAFYPGSRYHGINVLSAPFILMTTIGTTGLRGFLRGINPYKQSLIWGAPADSIALTDKLGRSYTAEELRFLLGKFHTGFTQQDVIFHTKMADEMMNDLGRYMSGQEKGAVRRLASKYLAPQNRNFYQRIAQSTDQHWRNNVFLTALEDGKGPAMAATLGRRSMLDYGAIDPAAKNVLLRFMMFVSFRMMNLTETSNALYRAFRNDNPSAIINAIKANAAMQKKADIWLYSDDDTKSRLFLDWREHMVADERIYNMGPMIPAVEAFQSFLNVGALGAGLITGQEGGETLPDIATDMLIGGQYRPAIDLIKKRMLYARKKEKGGGNVPPEWIWWMDQNNALDFFRAPKGEGIAESLIHFNITPRPLERRTLTDPTWQDTLRDEEFGAATQYNFTTKRDELKAAGLVFIALILGQKRAIDEFANTMMAAGVDPEGKPILTPETYIGRKGVPHWAAYFTALQTPKAVDKRRKTLQRKIDRHMQKMEDMIKSYSKE